MSDSELESLKCGPNDGGRRNNKPLMERRRRARINTCLNQLKTLVLEAMKKDTSRYSKLEKADILEMTVRYLRNVQRSRMTVAFSTDPSVVAKYRAGFNECAREVSRYLDSVQVDGEVRSRLMNHLATSVTSYTQSPSQRQQQVPVMQPIHVQIPSQQPNTTFLNNPGFMQNGQTVFATVADNAETVKNLQYVPAAIGPDGRVTYLIHSPPNQKPVTRGLAPVTRGLAPVTLANINAAYPRSQVYNAPTEYPHIAMDAPDMPTDLSMNSCSPMSCSSASTPPSTPMSMRLVTKIRPSIVKREPVWRPW